MNLKISQRHLILIILIFGLAATTLISLNVHFFHLRALLGFLFLVFVPGVLILKVFKIRNLDPWNYLMYVVGLSVSILMVGGLLINWLLPVLNITSHPLALTPLLVFFNSLFFITGIIAYKLNKSETDCTLNLSRVNFSNAISFIVPMLFPLFSVLGAITLNNGGTNYFTMVMLWGVTLFALFVSLLKDKFPNHLKPWLIFCTSLAVLLMYSLRSWHVLGWDIHQELTVFQETFNHARWSMSYFPGQPYNACLSITILPTIFSNLLSIPNEYIFKVVFNILFAFVPVGIYQLLVKFLNKNGAFLGVIFFISQIWFYEQMTALMRQEIGILFYVLILLIYFDKKLPRNLKYFLFYFFTASLIVSHYSTAYFWIIQLGIVGFISYILKLLGNKKIKFASIKLSMFLMSLLLLVIWQVQITQSYSHSIKTFENSKNRMLEVFSPKNLESSLETVLYGAPSVNTTENVTDQYNKAGIRSVQRQYLLYDPKAYLEYTPYAVEAIKIVPSSLPHIASDLILLISKISKAVTSYLLLYLGFIVLIIIQIRKKTHQIEDNIIFALSGFSLVLLMLFLPNLQANYNFSRLYMQSLVLASALPIISAEVVFKRFGRYSTIILASLILISFIFTTGAVEQFTGGIDRVTLDRPYGTFEKFYVYDTEVESTRWIMQNFNSSYPIFADVLAGMRLRSYGGLESNPDIFPNSLSKNGYVYLSEINVKSSYGFVKLDNNTLVFNYPLKFVSRQKNLIYNNGGSQIYK